MSAPAYRYHWTHRSNLRSIARDGLRTDLAESKRRVVWMCESGRVLWAASHVAHSHQHGADDLVLLRVRVDGLELTRTSWPMVQTCAVNIRPSRIVGVKAALDTAWHSIRRYK